MELKDFIRVIPDFPTEGVLFKDITPLLGDGKAYRFAIDKISENIRNKEIDIIVGPEARGFIVGGPLAYALNCGFVPVRKKGKLPAETIKSEYQLEYGTGELYMHRDAIAPGQRVFICDDLLATGGTIRATIDLVEKLGGIVIGTGFFIELSYLEGRKKLEGYDIISLLKY